MAASTAPEPPQGLILRVCAWCDRSMGTAPNPEGSGTITSHGCCDPCLEKHFPGAALEGEAIEA